MPTIPPSVAYNYVPGITPDHQGKVRDTFKSVVVDPKHALVVTTDRLSAFDVVLPVTVPGKGVLLNAVNSFWKRQIFPQFLTDFVAAGPAIDEFLKPGFRRNPDLYLRGAIVKIKEMLPRELILRRFLISKALKAYNATTPRHKVYGNPLPTGLKKWSRLSDPLFTPTTKAAEGHDEDEEIGAFIAKFGREPIDTFLNLFLTAEEVTAGAGFMLIDSKSECALDGTICDELFTPESSRFCDHSEFEDAMAAGRDPQSFDKQFVRDYLISLGFSADMTLTPELIAQVHALTFPPEVVQRTLQRYDELARRLLRTDAESYILSYTE